MPPAGEAGAATSAIRPRVGALAVIAALAFAAVGGVLVFSFAWSLAPAAAAHADAACRPLGPVARDDAAPALELQDLDGATVSLADYRGRFVVLNFWATWCEPCAREWPDLDKLARRFEDRKDVIVLAVSIDEDRELVRPYLERLRLSDTAVELLWDPTSKAHESLGSEKIPDTYFVDESGRLRSVFVNVRAWGRADAYRCVESMLEG